MACAVPSICSFDPDRIAAIRENDRLDTVEQRTAALAKLEPMQQGDFEKLYEAMEGKHVNIRFLDPPLHEFVPTEEKDIELLAKTQGQDIVEDIKAIISSLHEFNPMMGHRGCRLAVTYPEIAAMQTEAVIKAAINVNKAHPDWDIVPRDHDPAGRRSQGTEVCQEDSDRYRRQSDCGAGSNLKYKVGTMIEILVLLLPRTRLQKRLNSSPSAPMT